MYKYINILKTHAYVLIKGRKVTYLCILYIYIYLCMNVTMHVCNVMYVCNVCNVCTACNVCNVCMYVM